MLTHFVRESEVVDINRIPKDLRLRRNTNVLIPIYAKSKNCRELTVSDLRKFGIEDILASNPTTPTFYVFYCTQAGDILGKLMVTEKEIIFEPLNDNLKGFYNYMDGDFRKNTKMGFIVNFKDIVMMPEALVTRTRNSNVQTTDQSKLMNETYYLRLDLCHTGNKYMCQDPVTQELYKKYEEGRCPIASFAIKFKNKTLIGDQLSNGQIKKKVNQLINLIYEGWKRTKKDKQSFTNVPCFDLHFHNICKGPFDHSVENPPQNGAEANNEEEKSTEISENNQSEFKLSQDYVSPIKDITAQDLHDNFDKISKLFGLKPTVKSILELQNQSLSNLVRDFPSLEQIDKVEILENPDILQKTEKQTSKVHVKYFEYVRKPDQEGQFSDYINEKTDLMDSQMHAKLNEEIPAFYTGGGWKLMYSTQNDGISYNT